MSASTHLPAGITVFERGWLSSNNILICGKQSTALIDSGYNTHATQTQLLVEQGLGGRPLDVLVNGKLLARAEVVMVDDHFGVRITAIVDAKHREAALKG